MHNASVLLVGGFASGKNELFFMLSERTGQITKPLALQYMGRFINAPDAFLENRRFYSALITAAQPCAYVIFVQSACKQNSVYPPRFAALFRRAVLGIISYCDSPQANIARAEGFLHLCGVKEPLCVDINTGRGLDALRLAIAL